MNKFKIILFSGLFFLSVIKLGVSQGELLNKGQSAGTFLFSKAGINGTNAYAVGYSYTHKRFIEGGISAVKANSRFSSEDATGANAYLAVIINTNGWVNAKGFFNASFKSEIQTSILGTTLFINNSKGDNKIVPNITIVYGVNGTGYSPGIDFKLGKTLNLVGGVNLTKFKKSDWILGLSVGLMFKT